MLPMVNLGGRPEENIELPARVAGLGKPTAKEYFQIRNKSI